MSDLIDVRCPSCGRLLLRASGEGTRIVIRCKGGWCNAETEIVNVEQPTILTPNSKGQNLRGQNRNSGGFDHATDPIVSSRR